MDSTFEKSPTLHPAQFKDRIETGRRFGNALGAYKDRPDVLVLGLPRGGVPVGFEVAQATGAPLDLILVRKLGCARPRRTRDECDRDWR